MEPCRTVVEGVVEEGQDGNGAERTQGGELHQGPVLEDHAKLDSDVLVEVHIIHLADMPTC